MPRSLGKILLPVVLFIIWIVSSVNFVFAAFVLMGGFLVGQRDGFGASHAILFSIFGFLLLVDLIEVIFGQKLFLSTWFNVVVIFSCIIWLLFAALLFQGIILDSSFPKRLLVFFLTGLSAVANVTSLVFRASLCVPSIRRKVVESQNASERAKSCVSEIQKS